MHKRMEYVANKVGVEGGTYTNRLVKAKGESVMKDRRILKIYYTSPPQCVHWGFLVETVCGGSEADTKDLQWTRKKGKRSLWERTKAGVSEPPGSGSRIGGAPACRL